MSDFVDDRAAEEPEEEQGEEDEQAEGGAGSGDEGGLPSGEEEEEEASEGSDDDDSDDSSEEGEDEVRAGGQGLGAGCRGLVQPSPIASKPAALQLKSGWAACASVGRFVQRAWQPDRFCLVQWTCNWPASAAAGRI